MTVVSHPAPRRLLVRGVNWLGDAVMTTPALLRLREKFPTARIILVTPAKLADLWTLHPAVDEIIALAPRQSLMTTAVAARAAHCDLALVFPNSPRSALEVWLAGIPQRIGFSRLWRSVFLTRPIHPPAGAVTMRKRSRREINELVAHPPQAAPASSSSTRHRHQLYHYLALTTALGAVPEPLAPRLFVSPQEIELVRQKFDLNQGSSPLFGLNPGAEYGPAKRWPLANFLAVANRIQRHTPGTWLLFGGNNDLSLADECVREAAKANVNLINLVGRTSLRELMVLLKLCRVLLTNDTGPMHVAAALDTPVVVPFGSTSPALTAPGLPGDPRHRLLTSSVPCAPCFLPECPIDFRCMRDLSVEHVTEAFLSVLALPAA